MSCLRPATPGFVVTLTATILLAIVSFSVPYAKSVYFLKASISEGSVNGSIIFGTLGYCLELSTGTLCSKPSIGYELDINSLVGNDLPIQIPEVVVKWITWALVLHIVALAAAALSSLFGLLAHVREMSMTCCSTFISGFAAVIALFAFIFDLVLFFVAKARISSVGSAKIGSAIWLTLAAWVLLFFSGCFYSCGKNCIRNRPPKKKSYDDEETRKARSDADHKTEGGLPKMPQITPLTADPEDSPRIATISIDNNEVHIEGEGKDEVRPKPRRKSRQQSSGGYVPAERGTAATDGYYSYNNRPQDNYSPPIPYPPNHYPPSPYQTNPYPTNPPTYPYPTPYPPNGYPPPQQPSVPSHASSVAPSVTHYGSYGYTPSPVPDSSYFSATGPGQHPNYNPNPDLYGENSLLDPPRPSALYPSIPPSQPQSTLNRPSASPDVIRPSPPPQQNSQRGYTLGDGNFDARRFQPPQPPSNPYIIQPSPSPQQLHSGYTRGDVDYEARPLSNQSASSRHTAVPYVPSPPLQQPHSGYTPENDNYKARRPPQPPSDPYITHPSPSPEESYQPRQRNYVKSPDDLPPVYTSTD